MSEEVEEEPLDAESVGEEEEQQDDEDPTDEHGFGRAADATAKVPSLRKNTLLRRDAKRHKAQQSSEEE